MIKVRTDDITSIDLSAELMMYGIIIVKISKENDKTSTAVSAPARCVLRVIVPGLFRLILLRVPEDHLIDLTQHFRRQPFAEVHHQ